LPSPTCTPNLSREGILQELLFAQGTARTPKFDDYTEDSYHVDKLDLLEGVRRLRGRDEAVVGLIVYGPTGPLWAYHVMLIVEEEEDLRANWVYFPHARITGKGTRPITREEYLAAVQRIASDPHMVAGLPTSETVGDDRAGTPSLESTHALLVADFSTELERVWHAAGDWLDLSADRMKALTSVLDSVLEASTITYTTALEDGHETSLCEDSP